MTRTMMHAAATAAVFAAVLAFAGSPVGTVTAGTPAPPACNEPLDFMLVFDESGSISGSDFTLEKDFGAALANKFTFGPSATEGGLATFGTTARLIQGLTPFKSTLINQINSVAQAGGFTDTGGGIQLAQNELDANGRPTAVDRIVVLTDGMHTTATDPVAVADSARAKGKEVIAIGVGSSVSQSELLGIAGDTDHLFLVSSFNQLSAVADGVARAMCPDRDLDGCLNQVETGLNAEAGGQRDPDIFWDFFDVWTDSSGSPSGWERSKQIDLFGDIFGVAMRFGAQRAGSPPAPEQELGEALDPPADDTSYHADYDRSPPEQGMDVWDMGPPDGTIDLFTDIFGVAFQFGHDCS